MYVCILARARACSRAIVRVRECLRDSWRIQIMDREWFVGANCVSIFLKHFLPLVRILSYFVVDRI